jgi:ABC-type nitrate/sulfonate/bicarbonate transport system substrate-binding protein
MMLSRAGMDNLAVKEQEIETDISDLLSGQVDIRGAYSINELIKLQLRDEEVNVISPADYGVQFYADTIATTDELLSADPDLVERFICASRRGWLYALEHPEEVAAYGSLYDGALVAEEQQAMMLASLPLIYSGDAEVGAMDDDLWVDMVQMLHDEELIDRIMPPSEFTDTRFIDSCISSPL